MRVRVVRHDGTGAPALSLRSESKAKNGVACKCDGSSGRDRWALRQENDH